METKAISWLQGLTEETIKVKSYFFEYSSHHT